MIEVQAAGGVVRNGRGETLMILRGGVWDLPKGKIEEGETAEQAAMREVSEETGIAIEALELGEFVGETVHEYDTYGRWERKRTQWFAMKSAVGSEQLADISDGQRAEGITEVRWVARPADLEPIWDNIKLITNYELGINLFINH